MKKLFTIFILISFTLCSSLFAQAQAEVENVSKESAIVNSSMEQLYGAMAVEKLDVFTLEEMLRYSLEDEKMALAEYEMIMDKFNISNPFANIIESEKTHKALLLDLYKKYNFEVPDFDGSDHLVIPESLETTFSVGVEAEIKNIAMYEKFLTYDLNDDVRAVFIELRDGSINHLAAFKRQADKY